jgi:3-oxoacyl-[acyl-carrier-protein] synthase III
MAIFQVHGSVIKGISAAVPETVVSNLDYEAITEAERKVLIKTTGIEKRHIARAGLTTGDLCYHAAEKLISELNWNRDEINLVVFVSQSPDHFLPATSVIIQDRLGLPKTTAAFDIMLGCSGYVYGLSVISSMLATGGFRKALLLAGDISTAGVNEKDKSTYPLFGDAGTATALEYDPSSEIVFSLQSDGSGKNAIQIPDGGMRHPLSSETFIEKEYEPGVTRHRRNLWLNGLDVFNFSVTEAPANIRQLMEHCQIQESDIDLLIMHQANQLMNETIRKKLKFPVEKVPYSLGSFGNTSSASIPLTMVANCSEKLTSKQRCLLAGFGVGLSWASCIFKTDSIICPPVLFIP